MVFAIGVIVGGEAYVADREKSPATLGIEELGMDFLSRSWWILDFGEWRGK